MLAKIIPELLIKNLRNVPSRKPDDHCGKLEKISPGAAYLYTEVILPKMQGKRVYTSKVNMAEFDLDDIEIVCDYFKDNIEYCRPKTEPLASLYEKVTAAAPSRCRTSFM